MLHNDITNKQCPIIAFNIDSLLFSSEPVKTGFIDRVINKFMSHQDKYLSRKLNKDLILALETLWSNYNYSIYLITFEAFPEVIEELLGTANVPYTRLEHIEDRQTLRTLCHNRYIYYFDTNEELLSYIGSSGALNIRHLREKVRG